MSPSYLFFFTGVVAEVGAGALVALAPRNPPGCLRITEQQLCYIPETFPSHPTLKGRSSLLSIHRKMLHLKVEEQTTKSSFSVYPFYKLAGCHQQN